MDAIRIEDGFKVVLKRVPAASDEIRIALHLSSDRMRSDTRNHTVPILDVIHLPDDKANVLLVMPYLRTFHTPPFHCRSEVVEALRQFLQVHISVRFSDRVCSLPSCRVSSSCMSKILPTGRPNYSNIADPLTHIA